MDRTFFALSLGIAAVVLLSHQASATPQCAPRGEIIAALKDGYHERRHSAGLVGADQLVELFTSGEGGSWTLMVTRSDGLSCILAAGHSFQSGGTAPAAGDPA